MEWLFSLLRFRNKYIYCLGIRRSVRKGCWILFSIILAIMAGVLIVSFTISRNHPCHFGLKRVMKSSIVSSSRPRSLALGDFNNDHLIDIVVANSGTNTIGIFLSQGDGVFAPQQTYLTGPESHPCSVAVGHLNDDDYVDIAVASYAINNITIFFGNGNGTFTDPIQISTGSSHPLFVITGDVNNDNATDLLVVNYGTNSIGIHLGYGDGSFHSQTSYSTDYDSLPRSIALGDFNKDNHLDIAVANYGTNNVGILLGYGNGTFANQSTYTTRSNSHPSSVVLANFNHDHHLDVVVSNNGSGNIGIFLGRGDGSFEAQKTYSLDLHSHPEYITVGDLNGDNELDVIIIDSINDRVHILLGDGNGSFANITTYDTVPESSPVAVAVDDFNKNNRSDVAVVNFGTNNVLVLLDYWIKPSARQANYKVGTAGNTAVAVSDFNNDHISDIVSSSGRYILVLNGSDDGTFDKRSISIITTSVEGIQYICVGDVNNDNWMDIVTTNPFNDSVGVLLGRGNGTFDSMTTYDTGNGSSPYSVALGDVNDDGRLDIVCANIRSGNLGLLLGNGDGTFATMINCFISPRSYLTSVALGDIDNDHHLDIVVDDRNGYISTFTGHDNGTCVPLSWVRGSFDSFSVVLADFNSDKNLDIAFSDVYNNNIVVYLGYGDGTFGTPKIYPIDSGARPHTMIVADFNNDNIADLATTVLNNDQVVIFYGHGNGSFTLARRYSTGFGSKPYGIAVAHFDQKKQLKIIVTLWGTAEVAILTEYTAAMFVKQVVCPTGSTRQPYSVAASDFTHDNRSDVIVAYSGTDNLGVLVGSGNGTLEREVVYGIGANTHPQYVITCDINQDQQLDIVSVNSGLNSITVMMGQGDGTFADERMYSTGNDSHPFAVVSDDLNSDGWLDLVVANERTDGVGIFFGFDYTTFQSSMIYSSNDSLRPIGIILSDFNNDGFDDIATAFSLSGKIGIYLGCGNGSFILTTTYSIQNGAELHAIIACDLNNDGRLDLVVSDSNNDRVGVHLGYGNGSFSSVRIYSSGGQSPRSVAVGDMNNDNRLDIVVANYQSGNVTVLHGYGNGTFSATELYYTKENFLPISILLCDLNNDDRLDIVAVNTIFGKIEIYIIYGSGATRDQVIRPAIARSQPQRAAVADFNNDNRFDIAVADYERSVVRIMLNTGNGNFAPVTYYSTGSGSTPYSLDIDDFNNDKILDIVVVNSENNDIVVLFGVGDGTFLLGKEVSTGIGSYPSAVAIGDFNNDTRLDIAVTNSYANNIRIFLGSDRESFASVKTFGTGVGSRPHSIALADVNNDRHMDIVVANYGADNVGVLLGNSYREFTSMSPYPTGSDSAPYCVAIADLNNDNYLDIIVTTSETDNIIIFLGDGNGTFVINTTYSTGRLSRPYMLVINDFNNDHIWDIAVANSGTSNIFLIYGSGDRTFENEVVHSLGYGYHPYSIAVTDLNGDGWMDIVVACYDTDHIETFIQMC